MKTLTRRLTTVGVSAALLTGSAVGFAQSAAAAPTAVSNLAVSSCPNLIQHGQTSGCVTRLQKLLNSKQKAGLLVDAIFGDKTRAAVKKWQTSHKLYSDGIVGPATKQSIDPQSLGARNKAIVTATNQLMAGKKYLYTWGGGHGAKPGVATYGNQTASGSKKGYGFDCSGFARAVYFKAFGYDKLGAGTSANQSTKGVVTSKPQAGDLVFFSRSSSTNWTTIKANVGHVAVYMGGDKVAHQNYYGNVQNWSTVAKAKGSFKKVFYVHYTG